MSFFIGINYFHQFPHQNRPICFTMVATNTLTAEQCSLEICFQPEECDESFYRLMNTANVNLYPNPTDDITIAEYVMDDSKGINELVLTDLQGRTVISERLKDTRGKVKLQTRGLAPGMYIISAKNNGRTIVVKKLIIQ